MISLQAVEEAAMADNLVECHFYFHGDACLWHELYNNNFF